MEEAHIKRRHRELSKQQAIYAAQRAKGATKQESAIMAGYHVDKDRHVQAEDSQIVKAELARLRAETVKATGISKEDIAQGLLEAALLAKTMADPSAMVRAYSELGKMLGHYAPEKKILEHEMGSKTLEAMRALPDAQLAQLAKGRVIEGEVLHVEGQPNQSQKLLSEEPEAEEDVQG